MKTAQQQFLENYPRNYGTPLRMLVKRRKTRDVALIVNATISMVLTWIVHFSFRGSIFALDIRIY